MPQELTCIFRCSTTVTSFAVESKYNFGVKHAPRASYFVATSIHAYKIANRHPKRAKCQV